MYEYQYNHQFYLAVHPTEPPCLFLYPQLRLLHNLRLRKSGYLCIKKRYTIPLNMLDRYDQNHPELRYQLTAESFATVANTFAMKISSASRGSCNDDHWTHSLSNVRRRPSPAASKAPMTHSEPGLACQNRAFSGAAKRTRTRKQNDAGFFDPYQPSFDLYKIQWEG